LSKLLFRRATDAMYQVVFSDGGNGPQDNPIAYVEPEHSTTAVARNRGGRSYAIWQDPHRQTRLAAVRTRGDSTKQLSAYEVYGAANEPIGLITYRRATAFPPRRTHWIINQAGQESPIIAKKGRVIWWFVWYLCFPLMIATVIISLFGSGDGIAAGTPKRLIWRRHRERALDYRPFRDSYRSPAPWLDPRLATALIALHQSRRTEAFLTDQPAWDPPLSLQHQ
jgi:hypothetical protein